ncbi:hypothetical protein [Synechococcus sp. BMK-MC-1]|uniref:hypothetical protein n=1 Tax=Synechococcus sp. BMK-MC-1 TaxID=1442551 RepID=UPI00164883D0|nr:hypothetical protein [Synechococcus sp. BMK-MC-1]
MGSWIKAIEARALIIHQELQAARALAVRMGQEPDAISGPYLDMLAKLYREDFAYASLADQADLVARFTGPGVTRPEPPVSLVTGAFSKLRTQIQHIAKSIAGLEDRTVRWPTHLDPHLSGLAYGSLVVGMRVPRPGEVDSQGQLVLEGVTDGLYAAVRDAVRSLPIIPRLIHEEGVSDEVYSLFPDPAVRDTVMLAAHKLAPSKSSKGITDLFLSCPGEEKIAPLPLTKKSREILRQTLVQPSSKRSSGTDSFEGVVREIDLDALRSRSEESGISAVSAASTTIGTRERCARSSTAMSASVAATKPLLMSSQGSWKWKPLRFSNGLNSRWIFYSH